MKALRILFCFLIFLSYGDAEVRKKVIDMTKMTLKKISNTADYDKGVMPVNETGGPTTVGISCHLRNIELDDTAMQLKLDLTFRMIWVDPRLVFQKSPDVDYLRFTDYSRIWVPDPFFTNSDETVMHESVHPEAFVRIQHNGTVLMSTRLKLKLDCPMDFTRFPHDSQKCRVKVASYGYTTSDILLEMAEKEVSVSEELVMKNRFRHTAIDFEKCPNTTTTTGNYSCLAFTISMDRTSSSYIYEWYMPCACLVIISFLTHLITPDNLLVRVLLTLGPLLCLICSCVLYGNNLVRYGNATAMDVYTGISFTVIFLTLLHVILFFFYATREAYAVHEGDMSEPKGEEVTRKTSKQQFSQLFDEKGELISKLSIMIFYCIFIFLYLIAYVP